ncbi:hypothetical protein VPH35_129398 [Triticum aestivum]
MEDLEQRLRLAVVAYVGGTRPAVSCQEAAEDLSAELRIPRHRFSIHKYHPEDFLVVFAAPELRNRALTAGTVEHGFFKLFVKPWLKQAQAVTRMMRTQVEIMIEGIPSHAWTTETAAELLGSSCLVESLAPETENREDLSLFKLRAWCVDPDEVPVAKRVWVPEPEMFGGPAARQPMSRALLEYKTLIHIGRMREHEGPERWLRPPSSDGSGQSGMPDDFEDFSGRGQWRVLPWTREVRDHRGGAPASGAHGGTYLHALMGRIGPSEWRIPPMASGRAVTARAPVRNTTATATGVRREAEVTAAPVLQAAQREAEGVAAQRETEVVVEHTPPVAQHATANPGQAGGAMLAHEATVADSVQRDPSGPADKAFDQGASREREATIGCMQLVIVSGAQEVTGLVGSNPARPCAMDGNVGHAANPEVETAMQPLETQLTDTAAEGWAPVTDLIQPMTEEGEVFPGGDSLDKGPMLQELAESSMGRTDVTTTGACMHEQLNGANDELAMACVVATQQQEGHLSAKEIVALGNIKAFCAGLLKKLAPPLLKEFEGMRGVKAGQDPFTPRRTTRSVCAGGARKTKASAAETVLLKTLGFDCDDLAVSEDALGQLRTVFDSPLQEPQLRAIAAIFGKAIPLNLAEETGMAEPLLAQ